MKHLRLVGVSWLLGLSLACGTEGDSAVESPEGDLTDGPLQDEDLVASDTEYERSAANFHGLTVTELMVAREGSDSGRHWVEIQNQSAETMALTGVRVRVGDESTELRGELEAGAFLVLVQSNLALEGVPEAAILWEDLKLDNSGDAVELVAPDGSSIDRVDYDTELGWEIAADRSLALNAGKNASSNDLAASWCVAAPTPGLENHSCPEFPSRRPQPGDLVISELLVDPIGDAPEWVELTNVSRAPLLLNGLELGDREETWQLEDELLELPPGERLVLTTAEMPGVGLQRTYAGFGFGKSTDTARLLLDGVLIDSVVWDSSEHWPTVEGAAMALDAQRLEAARNDSPLNWCSVASPTPGAANVECALNDEVVFPPPGSLVVTELMLDPLDAGGEQQWFEVANAGDHAVRLNGLEVWSNGEESQLDTPGAKIEPGARVVLTRSPSLAAQLDLAHLYQGVNLRKGEGVQLVHGGEVVFELDWSDGDWPLLSGRAQSLSPNGLATDLSAWCPATVAATEIAGTIAATPGTPNPSCVLSNAIAPVADDLVISELLVDAGDLASGEWVEIHNVSEHAVSLMRLELVVDDERLLIGDPSIELGAGEYLVLTEAAPSLNPAPGTYPLGSKLSLPNDEGTVTLTLDKAVLDTVSYSSSANWPIREGWSMALAAEYNSATGNDDALNWCLAWEQQGDWNHRGTPGTVNDACPFATLNAPLPQRGAVHSLDTLEPVRIDLEVNPVNLELMETASQLDGSDDPGAFAVGVAVSGEPELAGTMEVRGATARLAAQKSWKVRLDNGEIFGQNVLNLNKHPFDLTRLRQQLGMQLFEQAPHLLGLRTQFVHLFVNGSDYGLFTHVENRGRQMLRDHGLDERGTLIKVDHFFFDQPTSEERFSGLVNGVTLDVGESMEGLIAMLDALHSIDIDIDTVVANHFNRDNLLSFYAGAYLIDHVDSVSQNFQLYASPQDPERWYFLPWDFDGAFDFYAQGVTSPRERWRYGVANWWGQPLFQAFFSEPQNIDALAVRVGEIASTSFDQGLVNDLVDDLDSSARALVTGFPDSGVGNLPRGDRSTEVSRLRTVVERRAAEFASTVERPMPVWQATQDLGGGTWKVTWTEPFDLQGDPVTMTLALSPVACVDVDRYACFDDDNVVLFLDGYTESAFLDSAELGSLAPGEYLVNVRPTDFFGNWQAPFSQFWPPSIVIP